MKSNQSLIITAVLFLLMAVTASTILWSEISAPVKIAMFAFGFSVGILVGTFLARRTAAISK